MFARLLRQATSLFASAALGGAVLSAADAGSGSIAGSVSSTATHNALQGAVVSIPGLNRSALTDESGRFFIPNVPPGVVEVVVSYTGFDDARQQVNVVSLGRAPLEVQLKPSEVITMEKFTVATEREGAALSITQQRNALNIKNVVALDEWGVLPTQNVGELVTRLPGVTGWRTDEDNLIIGVSIRGQPADYTRLNIDGMSSTGVADTASGRNASLHAFSASMYEQIEVIAGQTPDRRADSLGGQLNLKTRSPLAMKERRRFNFSAGVRHYPSWADRNVPLANSPTHPDFAATYTEIFDVGSGVRNLGVVAGGSWQELITPFDWDFLQYQTTTNPIAFFRDYDKRSGVNYRFTKNANARVDYRWSQSTRVSLRFQYNAGGEPYFQYTFVNPFAGNQVIYDPSTTAGSNGAIQPGFTLNRTEIRPVTNSQMLITPRKYSFTSKNPTGTLVFEHDWGRLKVDHAYRWSNTHWDLGHGRHREGGQITLRTRDPIGFILDNSNLNGRVFNQTAGPSVYDISSYTTFQTGAANATSQPVPTTSNRFDKRDVVSDINEVTANINATYSFEASIPIVAKVGLDTVNRRVNNRNVYPRRWYAVVGTVPSGFPLLPLTEFERQHGGQRLPVFDPAAVATTLGNTAMWYEDVNFTATQQYTNRKIMEEGVDAAYVQAQAKFGKFTVLGGVRGEFVTLDTFTYFRARTTPIAAEPDHFKRAALDFARQTTEGDYQKYFPSIHLAYDITPNLKARSSWSTSYSRPPLGTLVPSVTANDTSHTVTIGNPDLRPQTAKNTDLKLEYYFKHSGILSASVYRKDIKDFISGSRNSGTAVENTLENGFDGLYGGYTIFQPANIGSARLDGFEAEYRQRLGFLPGFFRGLTVRMNFTYLKTQGNFGGATEIQGRQLAGFVPRAFNGGLQYNYGNFGASFDLNQTGEYPVAVSLTSPGLNAFRRKLTTMNAGVSYRVRPDTTISLSAINITENGPEHYLFSPDRPRQLLIAPMSLKFAVNSQF